MWILKCLVLLIAVSSVTGCQDDNNDANRGAEHPVTAVTLKYRDGSAHPDGELVHGSYSAIQAKRLTVIRDHESFTALWDEHVANINPRPEPPDVPFGDWMVVAAFAGAKPSGGYRYEVFEVAESDSEISVMVLLTAPGSSCATTQAITQPHHVVLIPDSDKEVRFYENQQASSC